MRAGPDPLVWWRAASVTTTTFLVGAVGHVSSGGLLPSWPVLAAMLGAGTVLSAVVLSGTTTTGRIVLLVVAGQTACHGLFSLTAGHLGDNAPPLVPAVVGSVGLPAGSGPRTGSLHDHYEATSSTHDAASALTVPDPAAMLDHLPMLVAHAVAAALVGLWLAAGERAAWALLTLVVASVVALLVVPAAALPSVGRRAPLRRRPATLPCLGRVSRCVVRRGPPLLVST